MTPEAARRKQIEIYQRMTPEQRLERELDAWEFACEVSRCGIRHQHPEATPEEVERLLQERIALGRRVR